MLVLREVPFHGCLDCIDFLKRVWPLDEMPSEDHRFRTATHDIATHMGFGDWDYSHLLLERLKLAGGPDDDFLRFIETAVHPVGRTRRNGSTQPSCRHQWTSRKRRLSPCRNRPDLREARIWRHTSWFRASVSRPNIVGEGR